jgi:putative hemolysin
VDPSSPSGSIFLFLVLATSSGLLSGLRNVLSHFQRQYDSLLANRTERPSDADLIERCYQAWHRRGFFESLSLGRFLLDLWAGFEGLFFFRHLGIGWAGSVALTLAGGYLIAHWLLPLLSQAFAHRLGGVAVAFYQTYHLLLMGAFGESLARMNESLLKGIGYDPKLSFLGKDQLNQLGLQVQSGPEDTSGLKEDEKEMIRSIFDLRETQAKEVMTPRVDVVALDIKSSWKDVMATVSQEKYSRIPVFDGDMDHVRGILHVMDLMGLDQNHVADNFRLSEFLREAYFVPRTKKIGDLMREFRQKHAHMAVVVDEYGGTAGIVTLEDILEEIVGEIHDEDEPEEPLIRRLDEGVFEIDPIVGLDDLQKEIQLELKPDDEEVEIDTLGGFILYVHGKVPEQGDTIPYRHLTFEVLEMTGQKMDLVKLTVATLVDRAQLEKPPTEKFAIDQLSEEKVSADGR